MKNDAASLRTACGKNGLLWTRAQLALRTDDVSQQVMRGWIAESELREQAARQLVRTRLAAAAERGNMASLGSARGRQGSWLAALATAEGLQALFELFGWLL